jgi:hypothetical protein
MTAIVQKTLKWDWRRQDTSIPGSLGVIRTLVVRLLRVAFSIPFYRRRAVLDVHHFSHDLGLAFSSDLAKALTMAPRRCITRP